MQISWQIPEQYLHDQGFDTQKWMIHKELGQSEIPRYEKYENELKYQRRSAVVQMRAASRRIL